MIEASGEPLNEAARRPLERRLEADLGGVRVHSDATSNTLVRGWGARALTIGGQIFFRSGEYDTTSEDGQRLLAHEAAHVVQQREASPASLVDRPGDQFESAARDFASGGLLQPVAAAPPAVQRQADDRTESAVEMPVPMTHLSFRGIPTEVDVEGGCDGLSLHGQANATFDGGRGQVAGQKVTTSTACADCGGQQCLHLTGNLVTNYSVAVAITMPSVPSGLTKCEEGKVKAFLKNVLLPHEKDHERRFKTYHGQTKNPVDITGCGKDDLQAQINALLAAEDSQRQADANNLSGAIDPFVATIDCSDCDS